MAVYQFQSPLPMFLRRLKSFRFYLVTVVMVTSSVSCVSPSTPIPSSGVHVVSAGETLYSIAWQYGYNYHDLADRNRINSPYTIYPGQVLDLSIQAQSTNNHNHPETGKPDSAKLSSKRTSSKIVWSWPVKGPIVKTFSSSSQGLNIGGKAGETIRSVASGNVVYAGTGLRQFGRLIIVKHNKDYLSAYAHNKSLLVVEGDVVKAKQPIATMGTTDDGVTMLHFEIRKKGKPVDPRLFLPKPTNG